MINYLRFKRSSTWAIMAADVRWPYFFCHVYVSRDTSFLSSRRIGRFGANGRSSVWRYLYINEYKGMICFHTTKIKLENFKTLQEKPSF